MTMASYNLTVGNAAATAVVLWLTYIVSNIVYNLYFHPLARFPGPLLMRVSKLPYLIKFMKGVLPFYMIDLHKNYGEVVRVTPDQLAFANPAAWNEIHGHRTKGQLEMEKPDNHYRPVKGMTTDIITADREEHGKLRRTLAHGFSEKALREQQPLVKQYVDLFVQRLHENCAGGSTALDMTAWYNYTTFDVIGDLAFGEPFGCLENSQYHSWVSTILSIARVGTVIQSIAQYPTLKAFLDALVPFAEKMNKQRQDFLSISEVKLKDRMEKFQERPDLVEPMLKRADEWGLTKEKLQANSSLLIIAGSETTATQLCGVTYLLMTNPEAMKKVTTEIRATFKTEDEINFVSVNELKYMNACLSEAFRLYPPVAGGLPRTVPAGGATICGEFIAEGSTVAVHHMAIYRDDRLWTDATQYRPERWLADPKFANDQREALQPFQVGPRNCLGRNLAYVEMRTILARTLWNFDLELANESLHWLEQKNYNLWDKPPLKAHLTPVVR